MNKPNLDKLDRLSWLLDSSIKVPGLNFRMGVDSLVGLIPGIGDLVGTLFSGYVIASAARMGVPKALLLRMVFNVGLEVVIGSIPILGDIFDIAWKANLRNVELAREYFKNPKRFKRVNSFYVGSFLVLLLTISGIMVYFTAIGIQWLTLTLT